MINSNEMKNRGYKVQQKFAASFVINMIVPWAVYMILRHFFINDTVPLSITAAVPAVRTLFLWLHKHKIDYIGVVGTFSFIIALIISLFSGGNSLPLKLVHPMVSGLIGIACIISVVIGKPLLMIFIKMVNHGKGERFNSSQGRKKLKVMTSLAGGILILSSVVHIIMALTLQTSTFVPMSHIVSWVTILTLIGSVKFIVPKIK